MTATWTSADLAIRVELADGCILFSADHGTSWKPLTPDEARRMAAGLCIAAERMDERDTERSHAA